MGYRYHDFRINVNYVCLFGYNIFTFSILDRIENCTMEFCFRFWRAYLDLPTFHWCLLGKYNENEWLIRQTAPSWAVGYELFTFHWAACSACRCPRTANYWMHSRTLIADRDATTAAVKPPNGVIWLFTFSPDCQWQRRRSRPFGSVSDKIFYFLRSVLRSTVSSISLANHFSIGASEW